MAEVKDAPLTEQELAEIESRQTNDGTMSSGCIDYACYCHADAKRLVAEVRRLRETLDRVHEFMRLKAKNIHADADMLDLYTRPD